MKMKAPDGMSSISLGGMSLVIADDRSVEVPDGAQDQLRSHGFRPWHEVASKKDIAAMSHAEMVVLVLGRTKETLEQMSEDDLRARLLATSPKTVILPDEAEAAGVRVDPTTVSEEDIDGMNRIELFAFLKAKGVAVTPPIKNEELRQYARMAVADEKKAALAEKTDAAQQPIVEIEAATEVKARPDSDSASG